MTIDKDVTKKVYFQNNDDENLPLTRCVCGQKFESWTFTISIYRENAGECPSCGRKLYFKNEIRVYEVGEKSPSKTRSVVDRFWEKIDKPSDDGCWEWKGGKNVKGYGEFYLKGFKHIKAHQVSWMLAHGEIPEGMMVLHTCDNPSCVNPKHLFLGTNQDNVDDKMRKGRWRSKFLFGKDHPQYGTNHKDHRLNENQVLEIVELKKSNKYSQRQIAKMYKVSNGTVNDIVHGRRWAWLTRISND